MTLYNASNPSREFLDTLVSLCQEPDVLSQANSKIRIRSPIGISVFESSSMLKKLDRMQSFARNSIIVAGNEPLHARCDEKACGSESQCINAVSLPKADQSATQMNKSTTFESHQIKILKDKVPTRDSINETARIQSILNHKVANISRNFSFFAK